MPSYGSTRPKVRAPYAGVQAIRQAAGLKQSVAAEKIAAILDTSFATSTLSLIESGSRGTTAEVLRAMETVYGLPQGSLQVDYEPAHDRRAKDAA